MTITARTARKLCTKDELKLFEKSRRPKLQTHSEKELKQLITRTRKLRDKWRGQAKRQTREARGKGKPRSSRRSGGGENTAKKAELFEDLLNRFEDQLQTKLMNTKQAKLKREKKAASPPKVARRKGASGKVKPAKPGTKAEARQDEVAIAAGDRIHGHVSSRGRRRQIRKDNRP